MLKRIGLSILSVLVLIVLVTSYAYTRFSAERLADLKSDSTVVQTTVGPIEYQIVGDIGPIVLFLHGTPGGYDQSIGIEGYRVLAPSRPGYLRTPIEIGRTPVEQADAYAALIDALEFDSVVVMGVSGGGPSAIAFAGLHPDRVTGLIAMAAVTRSYSQGGEVPFFLVRDFSLWATLAITERFLGAGGIVDLTLSPQNRQRVLDDPRKIDRLTKLMWSIWPMSQRLTGQQNDTVQTASLDLPVDKITVPTLVIHGTEDRNVPFSHGESLAKEIPHARLHIVAGGDHYMPVSHSEEIGAAVTKFLRSL